MNIVYVTDSAVNPEAGGIARITFVMAEALRTMYGYSVYIYYGHEDFVAYIQKIGECIVIVQAPCKLAKTVYDAKGALPNIRIIHVFHGTPGFELVPLRKEIIWSRLCNNIERKWTIKQAFLQVGMCLLPKECFYRILRRKYALPYGKADKIVVLSKGIIEQYQKIAQGCKNQFVAIPNALSFSKVVLPKTKIREVLIVARLDDWHKRILEILKIWALLQSDQNFADWTLRIVGEGIDKPYYEEYVQKHNVTNVRFEGHQNPVSYYQSASLLMMTSACEGLPMTILEAQQFGCVPLLYDSFASARDVIVNGENGILVRNGDKNAYVEQLKKLMSNDVLRQQMSAACVLSSRNYSVEKVAAQWNELLQSF